MPSTLNSRTFMISARSMTQKSSWDFNVKVGREGIFSPTVGQFSLHSNNAMRLMDIAAARNMVVCSTKFQHIDIHKDT